MYLETAMNVHNSENTTDLGKEKKKLRLQMSYNHSGAKLIQGKEQNLV